MYLKAHSVLVAHHNLASYVKIKLKSEENNNLELCCLWFLFLSYVIKGDIEPLPSPSQAGTLLSRYLSLEL